MVGIITAISSVEYDFGSKHRPPSPQRGSLNGKVSIAYGYRGIDFRSFGLQSLVIRLRRLSVHAHSYNNSRSMLKD